MPNIKLSDAFEKIKEGTYVFSVDAVDYNEEYGKLKITLKTGDGQLTWQNYNFFNADNSRNDKALKAFSYFARVTLGKMEIDEVDPSDLVNHQLKATVEYQNVENNGETKSYVRLTNLESVEQTAPQTDNNYLGILG